jgi:antitoxin HicB
MLTYPVKLKRDGDSIFVTFPDVPRAHTFGDSEADALQRAGDALETAFIALMAERKAIATGRK